MQQRALEAEGEAQQRAPAAVEVAGNWAAEEVAGAAGKRQAVVEAAGTRPKVVDLAAGGRKRRAARGWEEAGCGRGGRDETDGGGSGGGRKEEAGGSRLEETRRAGGARLGRERKGRK